MEVEKNEGRFYLRERWYEDGKRKTRYLYSYGGEPPTFYEPILYHALCENKLKDLEEGSVNLIIDDPPYGLTRAQWDKEPDWNKLTRLYDRVLADNGLLVIFGKQPSLMSVYNAFTNDGFEFRFELIWRKDNNPWVSNHQPISIHENIFVFKKKGVNVGETTFNLSDVMRDGVFVCRKCGVKRKRKSYKINMTADRKPNTQERGWQDNFKQEGGRKRSPISVLEYPAVQGIHKEYMGYAGQKPTDLLRWLILAMSDPSDTVLDPHAGSGSTLVACIPLCRQSIGIEVDQKRYQDGVKRVENIFEELEDLKHAQTIKSLKKKSKG